VHGHCGIESDGGTYHGSLLDALRGSARAYADAFGSSMPMAQAHP